MSASNPARGAIAWMARNPVASNLLMLTFIVGGLLAVPNIRQEVFPSFELDTVSISVPYPGASPEEVEQGILLAIEDAVQGLDGIKRVTSTASEGVGSVTAELLSGADGNKLLQDIKNEVDRITSFPEESEEPRIRLNVVRRPVLSIVLYGDVDEHVLSDLAQSVKTDLTRDERITLVEIEGVRPFEIHFDIPQHRLREHGLTLEQVAAAIRANTVELGGGGIKTEGGEILLRTNERRDTGREFRDIEILSRPDGSRLLLRDLADIRDGFADIDRDSLYNGKKAVSLTVYRIGDEDPISVSRAASELAKRLDGQLPDTIGVDLLNDRSEIYFDRIQLLVRNAGIGLVLVMLILGLFLEVRLAFWVMLGIPISFLGCLLLLPHLAVSINMISLFAFIIAVGIVVDDAIVVGESIYYERQRGKGRFEAAIDGTKAVAAPVVFAILTNIVAFLPLLLVEGPVGQLWRNIPIVITCVFLVSLAEALFILPSHLAHQKLPAGREKGIMRLLEAPQRFFGRGLERFIEKRFEPLSWKLIRVRYLVVSIGLAILILALGWVASGRLGFTFFPKVESDRVTATAALPFGAPIEETRLVAERLKQSAWDVLNEHGGSNIVRGIYAVVGGSPRGGGPFGGDTGGASHLTGIQVNLVPLEDRDLTARAFTQLWRERTGRIPGLESLTFKFNIGPGSATPINIELSYPDEATLEEIARRTARELSQFAGAVEIDDGIELGKPEWVFRLRPQARALGMSAQDLARQIRSSYFGAEARRQQRNQDEIKLYARLPESERETLSDLENLVLRTPAGGELSLQEAAVIERGRAYESIDRTEGRRVVSVTADVDEKRGNATQILAEMQGRVMPSIVADHPNLVVNFEGESRDRDESLGSLRQGFLLALFVLFALLAIPFRSYVQALVIMIAIPFGAVGAILGHLIMGYSVSFVSIMGLVALAGVVINDNILLIDTINTYRRDGMEMLDAIASAPARRFRPVLLTSLTTFLGLAPMIFETSVQARFMIPMAISLGFGILFSTLITLVLVPSLVMIVEDARGLAARMRSHAN
jgi:multidrug efflux pump subunit AcrB